MLRPAKMIRHSWTIVLRLLFVAVVSVGCQNANQLGERPQEDWLARVGPSTIALDDVVRYLKFQQIDTPEGDLVDVDDALLQAEALESLIEETLLLEAARSQKMVVSVSDVTQAWDSLRQGWGEQELNQWLQARDETVESFKTYLKRSLMSARYLNEQVYARASIRVEEIDEAVLELPEVIAKPRVKASQIVVASLEEAKVILRELRRGLGFEAAAREYSITPEGKSGGHLGWFEPEQMPKLYEQCFNMWPGQLSQVLSSEYGYVILKVHERETARSRNGVGYDRARVEESLLYKRRQELLDNELARLRELYPVEYRRAVDAVKL